MKKLWLLVLLGVILLVGTRLVVAQFLARAQSPPERPDYMLTSVKVSEVSVGVLIQTVSDWIIGGLGSFLLFLYFKIKHLEGQIVELRGQDPTGKPLTSHVMPSDLHGSLEQPRDGEWRTPRLAIAGLVLSCSGVVVGPVGCLCGIVCGHLARREIGESRGLRGKRIANAALIVGYVLLVLTIVLGVVGIVRLHSLYPGSAG